MQKPAQVTALLFMAAALSATCGCYSVRKSIDWAFAADYKQRYGIDNSAGASGESLAQDGISSSAGAEGQPVTYLDEVAPEDDGLDVSDFSFSNINDTLKNAVGLGPDHRLAVQLFRKGMKQYKAAAELRKQGKDAENAFVEAAETFESAAKRWPESALQQDALFMSGESLFFAEHYPDANDQYQELLKNYPNTQHIDKVEAKRFTIAQYWLQLDEADPQSWYTWNFTDNRRPSKATFSNAVAVLDMIRIDDPTGKFADDATMAAGNAYFADRDWSRAARFYEDLRKTFPSSEHQFQAHFLELKCRLNSYDGANYSVVPLQKAKELLTAIQKQFPDDSTKPANAKALSRAAGEIRYKLAEREWNMASYFDRRWEYGSAKYYYHILVNDYADTPFGNKAQARMAELADKPNKPKQQLGWLVKLFPDPYGKPLVAARPREDETR